MGDYVGSVTLLAKIKAIVPVGASEQMGA